MNIHGIIPPIVTPMQANEDLDLPRLCELIDHQIAAGVHGIFVLGTTGEFFALDDREKQQVIATAVEHTAQRVPVFAGTGAETTREAIRLTKLAEREGADGVSVITPYYIKPNQSEVADHYRRIAEATALPVILYSNPITCNGLGIEPNTVAQLAKVPNIVGIKDSSGDLQNLLELVRSTPDDFAILQGRDTLICAGLFVGAKGAVPTTANLAPRQYVELYEAFQAGDAERAKNIQTRLAPIRLSLTLGTGPGTLKQAMALIGLSMGPPRSPLASLSEDAKQKLRTVLQEAGVG